MGGSTTRMKQFAKFLQNELSPFLNHENQKEPENLSNSDRYVVYKVGPVLAVNVSCSENCRKPCTWMAFYIKLCKQVL